MLPDATREAELRRIYRTLFQHWGPQHWWPAQTRFEVIVGAYLTQNTAWTNVQYALGNLRRAGLLTLAGIRRVSLPQLEQFIRPAGYFRQKARRLKTFVAFLDSRYHGSLDRMFTQPVLELREQLLSLNGIGPETADSILLYAGNHPVSVVDAYTRRILDRHGILPMDAPYEEFRQLFERSLATPRFAAECAWEPRAHLPEPRGPAGSCHPPSRMSRARRSAVAQLLNEMHGLLVGVGKNYCFKSGPACDRCPLGSLLPRGGPRFPLS
jgi:endonuclease-3 related protein